MQVGLSFSQATWPLFNPQIRGTKLLICCQSASTPSALDTACFTLLELQKPYSCLHSSVFSDGLNSPPHPFTLTHGCISDSYFSDNTVVFLWKQNKTNKSISIFTSKSNLCWILRDHCILLAIPQIPEHIIERASSFVNPDKWLLICGTTSTSAMYSPCLAFFPFITLDNPSGWVPPHKPPQWYPRKRKLTTHGLFSDPISLFLFLPLLTHLCSVLRESIVAWDSPTPHSHFQHCFHFCLKIFVFTFRQLIMVCHQHICLFVAQHDFCCQMRWTQYIPDDRLPGNVTSYLAFSITISHMPFSTQIGSNKTPSDHWCVKIIGKIRYEFTKEVYHSQGSQNILLSVGGCMSSMACTFEWSGSTCVLWHLTGIFFSFQFQSTPLDSQLEFFPVFHHVVDM